MLDGLARPRAALDWVGWVIVLQLHTEFADIARALHRAQWTLRRSRRV